MLKTIKKFLGVLGLGACCVTLAPNGAAAHGEKALEPFIRMRTIQWYDVQWSQEKLNVNDELVITGKFHVAEDWPRGVPKARCDLSQRLVARTRVSSAPNAI